LLKIIITDFNGIFFNAVWYHDVSPNTKCKPNINKSTIWNWYRPLKYIVVSGHPPIMCIPT
jgi:hypothetical protein